MKFISSILVIVVSTILSVKCNSTKELFIARRDFNRFPKEIKLQDSAIFRSPTSFERMLLYQDSILFLGKAPSTIYSPMYYDLMNLKTKIILGSTVKLGRKSGETLGFLSGNIIENHLWGHDVNKKKLFYYNIDSVLQNAQHTANIEYSLKSDYYYIAPLNKEEVLAFGNYYDSDNLLDIVDLKSGNVKHGLFSYKHGSGDTATVFERNAYESSLHVQPGGKKAVLARKYADEIVIIDIAAQTLKKVGGSEGYAPSLTRGINDNGEEVAMVNDRTRYGFVRGQVTAQYIYLLYSGNTMDTPQKYFGNKIYVYDWGGNPIKKIQLKNYVQYFTVSKDDKKIYFLLNDGKTITTANLL